MILDFVVKLSCRYLKPRVMKLLINIIGTSKVALSLTKILLKHSYEVGYVVSRSRERAVIYCQKLGQGTPVEYHQNFLLSGITFFGVPDDVLDEIYKTIKDKIADGTLIHFSGFKASEVFYDADERNIGRAVLHPNLSFADPSAVEAYIDKCCFGIEGNPKGIVLAEEIARTISNCYIKIPPNCKPAYHLAAVIASNFVVGLAYLSEIIYEKYKIEGFEKIIPALMLNTVTNISKLGVKKSLTGPVARGDWKVVEAEKEIFTRTFPDFANLYDAMVNVLKNLRGRSESAEHTKINCNER